MPISYEHSPFLLLFHIAWIGNQTQRRRVRPEKFQILLNFEDFWSKWLEEVSLCGGFNL